MRHLFLALIIIAATAGPLYAQPRGHGGERGDGPGDPAAMQAQLEKLNLTDDQRDAMRDIRVSTKKQMIDLRADLQKARLALGEILRDDAPDRAAFERTSRDIADLQVKQKLLLFDSRQEVLNLLTAEQQEEFRSMAEQRRMMRAERMKEHERGPRGRR